ncbi:MAG: Carbohydrate Esterase Family 4 [Parcubacteria bacterium C7867-001]|nr:MAG: Carbohydrate Esterase Family 4 [Parcubacteria bacterium C7867-001]
MFFEFSNHKLIQMISISAVLAASIIGFILLEENLKVVERTGDLWERFVGDLEYQLAYGTRGNLAAAAVTATGQNARAIPVLLYHGTPPEGNDNPPLPQEVFVEQMHALKAAGWHTITLDEFRKFMQEGRTVPEKSFLLTFDDARKESFYPVDPVLKDLNYTAVMFVITGFSLPANGTHSTFYLSDTELEFMDKSGRWELESHGDEDHRLYDVPSATSTEGVLDTVKKQHFLSNRFWLPEPARVETQAEYMERIRTDMQTSKDVLENLTGKPVIAFAYPFNDYGQAGVNYPKSIDLIDEIARSIYTFTMKQVNPAREDPFNYPNPSVHVIKRIEPIASWTGTDLVRILESSGPKQMPYTSSSFLDWSGNWGSVSAAQNVLSLHALSNTTGSVGLLNGSNLWNDYTVRAEIGSWSGSDISLIARYRSDSEPFLSCAFSKNRISLETHENGTQLTVRSQNFEHPAGLRTLSMRSVGSSVTCSADGESLTASVPERFAKSGSVGIEVWSPTLGSAALTTSKITVTSAR